MPVLDAKKTYQNLLSKGFKAAAGDHKYLEYFLMVKSYFILKLVMEKKIYKIFILA